MCAFVHVSDSNFLMSQSFKHSSSKLEITYGSTSCRHLMLLLFQNILKEGLMAFTVNSTWESFGSFTACCAPEEVTQFSTQSLGTEPKSSPAALPGRGLPTSCVHIWMASIFLGLVPISSGFQTLAKPSVIITQVYDKVCTNVFCS